MSGRGSADSSLEMLRLGIPLFLAMTAVGQVLPKTASIWIDTAGNGDLHVTLRGPIGDSPSPLAGILGCEIPNPAQLPEESNTDARCLAAHPSKLTFHAVLPLARLTPWLQNAEVKSVTLILSAPRFRFLHLAPEIPAQSGGGRYYRAEYSLDQLPREITIDGGFEASQVRTLLAWAVALMLSPCLILLLHPSDLLRLRVQLEALFVLGWTGWIWLLLRTGAGPLLNYILRQSTIGTLLVLLVPPLVAVLIGSRLAAGKQLRLAPHSQGVAYYRRVRFWTGAAAACFLSTLLNLFLSISSNVFGSLIVGVSLTVACLVCSKRISRGGSRPLAEGDLRKRAFELAARAGVKLRGVSVLTSPSPRPPLAFAARWGVVLINEALLARLSRREVDAVMCHELSHLRPATRSSMIVIYALAVVSILATMWVPNVADFVPLFLLAAYFSFKGWRRAGEFQADRNSVLLCGDPEAMITGLARVSYAHNLPLEWGAPVSWMMAHPPTMNRLRALARAARLSDGRLAELLEESRRDATDHYLEAQSAVVPEDAAFSPVLRKRLEARLSLYLLLAPGLWGLLIVWMLERFRLPGWVVLGAGSVLSMIAIYLCAEWISGSVRAQVKQRAVARHGQGEFTGFSPAAEPRLFDGAYHYDLGLARFVDGLLEFAGDRANFTLDPRAVERVWLGAGPRHWTPRKVVYIECRPSVDASLVTFSLQTLESWFWPATVWRAKRFYRQIEAWHKTPSSAQAPPQSCALPEVEGSLAPTISPRAALRWAGIYSGVGLLLGSIETTFDASIGFFSIFAVFYPSIVCGVLAMFIVLPRIRRTSLATLTGSPSRVPTTELK